MIGGYSGREDQRTKKNIFSLRFRSVILYMGYLKWHSARFRHRFGADTNSYRRCQSKVLQPKARFSWNKSQERGGGRKLGPTTNSTPKKKKEKKKTQTNLQQSLPPVQSGSDSSDSSNARPRSDNGRHVASARVVAQRLVRHAAAASEPRGRDRSHGGIRCLAAADAELHLLSRVSRHLPRRPTYWFFAGTRGGRVGSCD